MKEIIKNIEVVSAVAERQSTCVLCDTPFWWGTDLVTGDGESEIVVSPCECYKCDDSTYIVDDEDFVDEVI